MNVFRNEFKESDHPRAEDGKFVEKGGGTTRRGTFGEYKAAFGKGFVEGGVVRSKSVSGGSEGKSSPLSTGKSVDYWARAGDKTSPSADAFAASFLTRATELGIENLVSSAKFMQGWLGALIGGKLLKNDTQYFYEVLRSMPGAVIGLSDNLALAMYRVDKARTPEQQGAAVADFLQTAVAVFGPAVIPRLAARPKPQGGGPAQTGRPEITKAKETVKTKVPMPNPALRRASVQDHGKGEISRTLKHDYEEYLAANYGSHMDPQWLFTSMSFRVGMSKRVLAMLGYITSGLQEGGGKNFGT